MKKFPFLSLLFPAFLMAQSIKPDSAISRDGTIGLKMMLPQNHRFGMVQIWQNGQRIFSTSPKDTTSPDSIATTITGQAPGTYAYQLASRRYSLLPCQQSIQIHPSSYVQVGSSLCRVPLYLNLLASVKSITYTIGFCRACSTYSVVFRRLSFTDPNLDPAPNTGIQESGTRLNGYSPTAAERAMGFITRTSSTSFGQRWYQVDAYCGSPLSTNTNRITRLVYVR
jgi:hypothetical protein